MSIWGVQADRGVCLLPVAVTHLHNASHFFTQHLDKTLLTVTTLISQDERVSSNPVAKIIYGDPANFLHQLPQKNVVHCSKIWSCRKKITVEYLQHIMERKNGKEMVPVLWQFLQKVCPPHGLPPFSWRTRRPVPGFKVIIPRGRTLANPSALRVSV